MLLADYATVSEGKLFISGGGWSVTGPAPTPSALAIKIDVPWDRANDRIQFHMQLLAEDGAPVTAPGPLGEVPIELAGEFEVGRPPGLKHGTPVDIPLAFNVGPLPLQPGRRYSWQLLLDGKTQPDWHLAFTTREVLPPEPTQYVVDPPT